MKNNSNLKPYIIGGIFWSALMYLFMVILIPYAQKEEITHRDLLMGIPVWIIGGLIYTLIMIFFMKRKRKKKERFK